MLDNSKLVAAVTMRDALSDSTLLGNALPGDSWSLWRTILIAAMGEPLNDDELAEFRSVTGGRSPPAHRVDEAAFIVGRRGGKDRAASVLSAYFAGLVDWSFTLAAGEKPVVLAIAPDLTQARIQTSYIHGVFKSSSSLSSMLVSASDDEIELCNGLTIASRASNFRRLRGQTCVAVVASEIAYYFDSESMSANSDTEILNAVRPTLATTQGPLIVISSPYRKRGELWSMHRDYFGRDNDDVLIVHGDSKRFNPSLPQKVIDRAMERDRALAESEYGAKFRDDLIDFVSPEVVAACVDKEVRERAYPGWACKAFVDPSGGSSDSMTLCIGHEERNVVIVDCVREIAAPFDAEKAVAELVRTLKIYNIKSVTGDRYGGQWVAQAFKRHEITYEPSDATKSDLYIDLLPRLNSKTIRLVNNPRLIAQLCSLERRVSRGGKDSIDHPPRQHDDLANAVAGLAGLFTVNKTAGGAMYATPHGLVPQNSAAGQMITNGWTMSVPKGAHGFDHSQWRVGSTRKVHF